LNNKKPLDNNAGRLFSIWNLFGIYLEFERKKQRLLTSAYYHTETAARKYKIDVFG